MTSLDSATIGIDESGKGDFFGPLVVAAVACKDSQLAQLTQLGVRDCKLLSDSKLNVIDSELRERFPFAVLRLMPEEYNNEYLKLKNLNKLLAFGHASVLTEVYKKCPSQVAISDQFGKPELLESELRMRKVDIELRQIVRAEQFPPVAAASIIARAEFIKSLETLSAQFGIVLPKGAAAHVDTAGQKFVARYGAERLKEVAKLHFKNYQRAVQFSTQTK